MDAGASPASDGKHRVVAELTSLTLAEARDGLRAKKFSAREIADAHLAAMEKAKGLNAYILPTPEKARAMAAESDKRLAKGEGRPLEGIALGVKDMFATEGVRTTACSKILDQFAPGYESRVTANLWRDGAVMLGKTNNDEFAMGSSNETSAFGPVTSPWRRKGSNAPLVPGGSSGGSAAAVAAQLCLGATGTDTGGSIRQPAAFAGIVGIKPTYGRCSRWGIVAFASSLDQAGPVRAHGEGRGDLASLDGGARSEGFDECGSQSAGFRKSRRPIDQRPQDRHSEGIPRRGHVEGNREAVGGGGGVVEGGGRRDRRDFAAAHEIRAPRLLHRGAGRGFLQPRAL